MKDKTLSPAQIEEFKEWCTYYISELGLRRYRVDIKSADIDACASVVCSQEGAWATITVNKKLEPENGDMSETLRLCALHECLHLLLSHYKYLADSRYGVCADDMTTEEEKIIAVLERIIP